MRLAVMLTSSSTSIHLIPMKVTEATQADLNVSPIQYWAPQLGVIPPPWHLSWAYESLDVQCIYLVTGVKWSEAHRIQAGFGPLKLTGLLPPGMPWLHFLLYR